VRASRVTITLRLLLVGLSDYYLHPLGSLIPIPSPLYNISHCYKFIFSVNLFGDHIRRVDHAADVDRAILRQVYVWAEAKSAIYLDGCGYRDAEDFLDPPSGSVEYLVFAGDRPAALLTLIPLVTVRGVYQAGLITNPDASLRKICKLLRGFMGAVFERLADALFIHLPDSPEFSPTRNMARFFDFKQVSTTSFLITKFEYGYEQKRKESHDDAVRDDRLYGRVKVLRHHA
jgi:hypothetical protein